METNRLMTHHQVMSLREFHSGSFTSGFSPLENDKSSEVPKWTQDVDLKDHFERILICRSIPVEG
jgi:hypothetical protein